MATPAPHLGVKVAATAGEGAILADSPSAAELLIDSHAKRRVPPSRESDDQTMRQRQILDRTRTPDGALLELALEANGHYVIRVDGAPLMSSGAFGSEKAMATVARELLGGRQRCKVLVGGLGMGYTCRAVLEEFGPDARVTVAELLPSIVAYNRGPLGPLADHPLDDSRVQLFEGNVRDAIAKGGWDAILMDVDDGPDPRVTPSNKTLYSRNGVARMARALAPGGVLIVWSSYASKPFEVALSRTGLAVEARRVWARTEARRGSKHTLFIGRAPRK